MQVTSQRHTPAHRPPTDLLAPHSRGLDKEPLPESTLAVLEGPGSCLHVASWNPPELDKAHSCC